MSRTRKIVKLEGNIIGAMLTEPPLESATQYHKCEQAASHHMLGLSQNGVYNLWDFWHRYGKLPIYSWFILTCLLERVILLIVKLSEGIIHSYPIQSPFLALKSQFPIGNREAIPPKMATFGWSSFGSLWNGANPSSAGGRIGKGFDPEQGRNGVKGANGRSCGEKLHIKWFDHEISCG